MSRICELCDKSSQKGNKITKIWGVKYRSIRHRQPNLRKVQLLVDGVSEQKKICAKCLKTVKNGKTPNITFPEYVKAESPATK